MEDWKEKFLELFMESNFKAALDYKRDHLPSKLYRYRPASGEFYTLNEIATGQIYLAHHKDLNDPFDASSIMANKSPSKYFRDSEKAQLAKDMAKYIPQDTLEKILSHDTWYEEILHVAAQNALPGQDAQRVGAILEEAVTNEFIKINQTFNDMSYKMSRLACFTTKPCNLPMWANYAENHKGVCLEYNTRLIHNIYTTNRLFPVYYTDHLPDVLQFFLEAKNRVAVALDYIAIHKSKDWEYEDEWRLIYNAGSWYMGPNDVPEDFWDKGKVIQFIRPSRVLLGAKMYSADEKRVREVCKKYNIPVAKMKITQFGLQEGSDTTQ